MGEASRLQSTALRRRQTPAICDGGPGPGGGLAGVSGPITAGLMAQIFRVIEKLQNTEFPMVIAEILEPGIKGRLILQPNRSLSWQGNLFVLFSFLLIFLVISVGFAMVGVWIIAPFAGLELSILYFVFCCVYRRLQNRIEISIDEGEIEVRKGRFSCSQCWVFKRLKTVVIVGSYAHSPQNQHISLAGDQGLVDVGQFLTRDDQNLLVQGLAGCGLAAHHKKKWSNIVF